MKGVDVIFQLGRTFKEQKLNNIIIDIYGPIYQGYKLEFENELVNNEYINYKGVLQQEEIYQTLEKYDLMLFPTKYFTEGFPGSILDAYIAEVPVLVTKWKYAEEFVEDNVSGMIVDFDNPTEFIHLTLELIRNPQKIKLLKESTKNQKLKYSAEAAWELLREKLFSLN